MSNQLVGQVFARIIDEVMETSRVDFEEGGVEQNVLEELRQMWRQRLSNSRCAPFPWDPQAAESSPNQVLQPPTVPSNAAASPNLPQSSIESPVSTPTASGNNGNGPHIKSEPGYEENTPLSHGHPLPSALRAAENLQRMYGDMARPQIVQLRAQAHAQASAVRVQPHQQQIKQDPGLPQHMPPQYQQGVQHQNSTPNLAKAQVDGGGDSLEEWRRYVAAKKQANPAHADNLMRQLAQQNMQRMEGGGLLVPLDERPPSSSALTRELAYRPGSTVAGPSTAPTPTTLSQSSQVPQAPQLDGNASDDDDAINSDLDDPEEENVFEEDESEAGAGQIMVCTYDKVQRVKNKWKCTLKDGLLTTGGKEYVFHKAQGEFEW
ncbi:MAG: transcription factor IIA subunit alpha [Cirrosporium novae-zelandiae]|nr:MAG: transcription factor IIA subunit alpha [Cirrosporium novae-zelandiae]